MTDETTMVKAEINDKANGFIESIRDKTDMNKSEATAYVLEEVGRASAFQNELEHRLARAEPTAQPTNNDE